MSQLRDVSIERLCMPYKWWTFGLIPPGSKLDFKFTRQVPMIEGFSSEKKVIRGKSAGLSAASYDVRIAHDLYLQPMGTPGCCGLAYTIERFCMPDNVAGYPYDKSTYARVFVSALNTYFDPGFSGKTIDNDDPADPYASAVLELVNFGEYPVDIKAGDPVCQFIFHWLDGKSRNPYRGKYAGQKGAQAAIYEKEVNKPNEKTV
jgi:hypothetical protein